MCPSFLPLKQEEEEDEEEEEEASLEEIKSVVVRRHRLEEWHGAPFFQEALPGSVVRVVVGSRRDPQTGAEVPHYVAAQVMEVEERSPGVYK